jgi:hypothetical protein
MAGEAEAPAFSIGDALEILHNLGSKQLERLILVGGQAAAFWIARYDIAEPYRVTTKDIDVFSSESSAVAVDCAKDLGGEIQAFNKPRSPDVARVLLSLRGAELQIDFLRSLHGIATSDVIDSKLAVPDERMHGKLLYVMHPALALASRLINTFELDGRLTEENLTRLQFSVRALHAYLMEELSAGEEEVRVDVLPSIERVFKLALSRSGLRAWHEHEIDVFRAAPNTSELSKSCPKPFLEKRLPQMFRELARKRKASKRRRHSRSGH